MYIYTSTDRDRERASEKEDLVIISTVFWWKRESFGILFFDFVSEVCTEREHSKMRRGTEFRNKIENRIPKGSRFQLPDVDTFS